MNIPAILILGIAVGLMAVGSTPPAADDHGIPASAFWYGFWCLMLGLVAAELLRPVDPPG